MIDRIFTVLYILSLAGLSIYGLQAMLMSVLFMLKWKHNPPAPRVPEDWPTITIQLPVFNEKYVIERLIDAACSLDYPSERLSIQVLDDSTDKTTCLAAHKVRYYRNHGMNISLLHRRNRAGYKAGALAAALPHAMGELIAVFDADFLPPKDLLQRMVPYLVNDPKLGMVQARWSHLNADYNLLTRSQALLLDGYFVIEQTARSRSGLLFNFNGSGGIWRKSCIVDSGGWQDDTLAEDLDLSYRAQMNGWRIAYLPHVVVPGELPPQIAAFKQQQYRWTRGGTQVLRKYYKRLKGEKQLTIKQRLMGYLQLSGSITYLFTLVALLTSLPVVLNRGQGLPFLPWLSLAGLSGPLLYGLSQATIYRDWLPRLMLLPVLLCLRIGLTFSNARAVIAGFGRNAGIFERTPKYRLESRDDGWQRNKYRLHLDIDILADFILGIYSAITLAFAVEYLHRLVPAMAMFTVSFLFTGVTGLVQSFSTARRIELRKVPGEVHYDLPNQQPPSAPTYKIPIY